jgi:hypothetical protein
MTVHKTYTNKTTKLIFGAVALLILAGLSYFGAQTVFAQEEENPSCSETLPQVEYLGEGSGEYILEDGFDTFIVKQRQPFEFLLMDGTVNAAGQTVFNAPNDDDRVWACAGNCDIPAVYHDKYDLGYLTPGYVVNLLVIDDDGPEQNNDQRYNWWAYRFPGNQYLVIEDQQMVEYLTLEIPFAEQWYYYAEDSIGIVTTCIEEVTSTPTPTPSDVAPTETPVTGTPVTGTPVTGTPGVGTPTATPVPPTETPAVETPTTETPAVETPTGEPPVTSTPTPTPEETPGGQATPETPPVTTPATTPTATAMVTETPVSPNAETATPTPFVMPPTAIELVSFTAVRQSDAVVVQWSTSFEESTFGYYLYRSTGTTRDGAVLVTEQLIASQGTFGGSYAVTDSNVQPGVTYTYWLDEVEIDGTVSEIDSVTVNGSNGLIFLPYTSRS